MEIKLDIKGLDQIQEAIRLLPEKLSAQLINSTLRRISTETLVNPIRTALPYKSKTVRGVKVFSTREKTKILVGPSEDVYWLRFVEKGTKDRVSKNGVRWRGINSRPIIKPVSDSQIPILIDKINNDFGKELNDFILKRLKKISK